MGTPLSDAELLGIRQRWEATERRIVDRETAARRAGVMGDLERLERPAGHDDIPRLLAAIDALKAERVALIEDGNRLHSVAAQSDVREHPYVDDWRRLVMDCA